MADRLKFLDNVIFELKIGWKAYLAVVAFCAFIAILFRYAYVTVLEDEYAPVNARITSFEPDICIRDTACGIVVHAVTADGRRGMKRVDIKRVRGCKIGDAVRAEQSERRLRLVPEPCL